MDELIDRVKQGVEDADIDIDEIIRGIEDEANRIAKKRIYD